MERSKKTPFLISLLACSLLLWSSTLSWAATCSDIPYKPYFEQYGAQYIPELDWRWFAAQARAESNYDPHARSHVGARGVMQLMPATFAEQSERLRERCSPWSPRCSIKLGIHYDKRMYSQFRRPFAQQRVNWMLASYNAGLGTVLRHQAACGGSKEFIDVMPCLYDETREYVERINRFFFE